jgi:hypothetical protein
MNILRKATTNIILFMGLLILNSCGGGSASLYCTPNFTQGNIALKVTHIIGSLNTYEFQVCYNDSFRGKQVTVYGAQTYGDIATLGAANIRLASLTDGLYPGDEFTVTFNNNDTWFAIYEDVGGIPATTKQIIIGEFR